MSVTSILLALSYDMIRGEISNDVPYNALVVLRGRFTFWPLGIVS